MGVCECVCAHAMGGKVSVKLSPLPYFKGILKVPYSTFQERSSHKQIFMLVFHQ